MVHLADAELIRAARLRFALAAEEPVTFPGFDEGTWKRRLHYLWRSPEAALALYDALVYGNGELLRQVDVGSFARGVEVDGEVLTVADLVRRGAAHAEEHASQVRGLRAELGEGTGGYAPSSSTR